MGQAKRLADRASDLQNRLEITNETPGGVEHDIWFDELTERAVKIAKDIDGTPVFAAGSPAAYLENLRRRNALFGTEFAFQGMVGRRWCASLRYLPAPANR